MPRSHASLPRLFVTDDLALGASLHLGREQSNYLAAVLRMKVGEAAVLFNGRHGAFRIVITADAKKNVVVELVEQIATQPEALDLWYGFAPLKTGRLDYMVQKATEMGVGTMQPVTTRFTQVHRLNLDKVRANAVEAAEQCEVLNVPVVAEEIALEKLIAQWPELHGPRKLIFADEGQGSASPLDAIASLKGQPLGLIIGPEGGFSDEERALLHAQPFVTPISLGPRILRADTAAVAALAVIQASIGDWR